MTTIAPYVPYVGAAGLALLAIYQYLTGDPADAWKNASLCLGLLGIHLNLPPVGVMAPRTTPTIASRPDILPYDGRDHS